MQEDLSLILRLSSKAGREESLVTSVRKAVNFQRIIINVVNVGHSHFSNDCHVIAEGSEAEQGLLILK